MEEKEKLIKNESEEPLKLILGGVRKLTRKERDDLKKIGKKTPYKWVVVSPFSYEKNGILVHVQKGFLSDGNSGGPDYGSAWLYHDYLYASHKFDSGEDCTRVQADDLMAEIMEFERNSVIYTKIFILVSKLNFLGLLSRAWRRSGNRGVEYLDVF